MSLPLTLWGKRRGLLEAKLLEPLNTTETAEREIVASTEVQLWRALRLNQHRECRIILDQLMGQLLVGQPEDRNRLQADEHSAFLQLKRFYGAKMGTERIQLLVLTHRQSAWFLWSREAAQRREFDCRFFIEREGVATLADMLQSFSASHTAMTRRVASMLSKREIVRNERLAALRQERERGVFAAKLADFVLVHDAARARLEWSEESSRDSILLLVGARDY